MSLDLLTPDQLTHWWSTAALLLATEGMKQSSEAAVKLLGEKCNRLKDWAFGQLGYTKVPALLVDVQQHPQDQAKKQALQEELKRNTAPAHFEQLQQMMTSIQKLVEQLQPAESNYYTQQTNFGTGPNVSATNKGIASGMGDAAGGNIDKSTHHHEHYHHPDAIKKKS